MTEQLFSLFIAPFLLTVLLSLSAHQYPLFLSIPIQKLCFPASMHWNLGLVHKYIMQYNKSWGFQSINLWEHPHDRTALFSVHFSVSSHSSPSSVCTPIFFVSFNSYSKTVLFLTKELKWNTDNAVSTDNHGKFVKYINFPWFQVVAAHDLRGLNEDCITAVIIGFRKN